MLILHRLGNDQSKHLLNRTLNEVHGHNTSGLLSQLTSETTNTCSKLQNWFSFIRWEQRKYLRLHKSTESQKFWQWQDSSMIFQNHLKSSTTFLAATTKQRTRRSDQKRSSSQIKKYRMTLKMVFFFIIYTANSFKTMKQNYFKNYVNLLKIRKHLHLFSFLLDNDFFLDKMVIIGDFLIGKWLDMCYKKLSQKTKARCI